MGDNSVGQVNNKETTYKVGKKKYDISKLKGGIRMDANMTELQKKIFEALDGKLRSTGIQIGADDNILDKAELKAALEFLQAEAGKNKKLNKKEFQKLIEDWGLADCGFEISKKDFDEFFSYMFEKNDLIAESEVQESEDGERVVVTTDKEGNVETRNADGSYKLELHSDNEDQQTTQFYATDNSRTKDIVKDGDVTSTTTYKGTNNGQEDLKIDNVVIIDEGKDTETVQTYNDANAVVQEHINDNANNVETNRQFNDEGALLQEAVDDKANNIKTTTSYKIPNNGQNDLVNDIVVIEDANTNTNSQIKYNENNEPIARRDVVNESTQIDYQYARSTDGNFIELRTQMIENKGVEGEEAVTLYQYGENGAVLETKTEPLNKGQGGQRVTKTVKVDGKTQQIDIAEGVEGKRTFTAIRNTEAGGSVEQITYEDNNKKLLTQYDKPIDEGGKPEVSQYYKGDKLVNQTGYKDGNLIIIRQFNKKTGKTESDAEICRRYGVTQAQLRAANKGNKCQNPGSGVLVPAKILADDTRTMNRQDSKTAIKAYNDHQIAVARRQEQIERDKQLRALGLASYKHAGETRKVTMTINGQSKEVTVTVLGEKAHRGRLLCSYKVGKETRVCTVNKFNYTDGTSKWEALDDGYLYVTDYYDNNVNKLEKRREAINHNGKKEVYVEAYDLVKDYDGDNAYLKSCKKWGNFEDREVVASYDGNLGVLNGKFDAKSSSRYVLKPNYFTASCRLLDVTGGNSMDLSAWSAGANKAAENLSKLSFTDAVYGETSIRSITVDGETFYFDLTTGGVQQDTDQTESKIAARIAADLNDASSGPGTKNVKFDDAIQGITNSSIRKKVEKYDLNGEKDLYDLIHSESDNDEFKYRMNYALDAGAYGAAGSDEQAKNRGEISARRLDWALNGGIGYTKQSWVETAGSFANSPEARATMESTMHELDPDIVADRGSYVRGAIKGDGWYETQTNRMICNSIVEAGGYDPNNQNDIEELNYMADQLVFGPKCNKVKNVTAGLNAVHYCPQTYNHYQDKSAQQNVTASVAGQNAGDAYLAKLCTDSDGKVDMNKFELYENTLYNNPKLFPTGMPPKVQSEIAMLYAKQDDYTKVYAHNGDDKIENESALAAIKKQYPNLKEEDLRNIEQLYGTTYYENVQNILTNEQAFIDKDVTTMSQLYDNAYNGTTDANDKIKIKGNAILCGKLDDKFSEDEIADFCIELMHSIDRNQGYTADDGLVKSQKYMQNISTEQRILLEQLLTEHPEIHEKVRNRMENEKFERTDRETIYVQSCNKNGMGSYESYKEVTVNTKNDYMVMLDNANTIANESKFYDENGKEITDPKKIAELKKANNEALVALRTHVKMLEMQYRIECGDEGWMEDAANWLSEYSGLGTDRGDVANEYFKAKSLLNQLEAAAQGKLRDKDGKVISAQQLAQQVIDNEQHLQETNNDYKQTLATGKMILTLGPVIVVTTVASGGAAAAEWGTLAIAGTASVAAGGTELVLTTTNDASSTVGLTAEKWDHNLRSAGNTAFITFATMGTSKVLGGLEGKTLQLLTKGALPEALSIGQKVGTKAIKVVGEAVGISSEVAVMQASSNLFMGEDGGAADWIMVGVFHGLGYAFRGAGKGGKGSKGEGAEPTPGNRLDNATGGGEFQAGGGFSDANFKELYQQMEAELKSGNVTPERIALMHKEIERLHAAGNRGSRNQARALRHLVEDNTGVYIRKNGNIDINTETDIAKLQQFRKEVSNWTEQSRNPQEVMSKIDDRISFLESNPEAASLPPQSETLNLINENFNKTTDRLLSTDGKRVILDDHGTSLIEERICKTTDPAELDEIAKGVQARRMNGTPIDRINKLNRAIEHQREVIARNNTEPMSINSFVDKYGNGLKKANGEPRGFNNIEKAEVKKTISQASAEELDKIEAVIKQNNKFNIDEMRSAIRERRAFLEENPQPIAKPSEAPKPVEESKVVEEPKPVEEPKQGEKINPDEKPNPNKGETNNTIPKVGEKFTNGAEECTVTSVTQQGERVVIEYDVETRTFKGKRTETIYTDGSREVVDVIEDTKRISLYKPGADKPYRKTRTWDSNWKEGYTDELGQQTLDQMAEGKEVPVQRKPDALDTKDGNIEGMTVKINDNGEMEITMNYEGQDIGNIPYISIQKSGNEVIEIIGSGKFTAKPGETVYFRQDHGGRVAQRIKVPEAKERTNTPANPENSKPVAQKQNVSSAENAAPKSNGGDSKPVSTDGASNPADGTPINSNPTPAQGGTTQRQANKEIANHLHSDELVREPNNGGNPIDPNYIQNSRECREYLLNSMDDGAYTASAESYMDVINEAHRISHSGVDRQHAYYEQLHPENYSNGRKINAGVIRDGSNAPVNGRKRQAQALQSYAKNHGDPLEVGKDSYVELPGISRENQPFNGIVEYPPGKGKYTWGHRYPSGSAQKEYFAQMHRTAREALDLIKQGASEEAILSKIAEHYQYAANARPYENINNSLFMNEINTLLEKAGLKTIRHGDLDFAAMYLQPKTFQRYFIEHYNNNAISGTGKFSGAVGRTNNVSQELGSGVHADGVQGSNPVAESKPGSAGSANVDSNNMQITTYDVVVDMNNRSIVRELKVKVPKEDGTFQTYKWEYDTNGENPKPKIKDGEQYRDPRSNEIVYDETGREYEVGTVIIGDETIVKYTIKENGKKIGTRTETTYKDGTCRTKDVFDNASGANDNGAGVNRTNPPAKPENPKPVDQKTNVNSAESAAPKSNGGDSKPVSTDGTSNPADGTPINSNPTPAQGGTTQLADLSYEELMDDFSKKLQSKPNMSDLLEHLNSLKQKFHKSIKMEKGYVKYFDIETKTNYEIYYDKHGNVVKYNTCKYLKGGSENSYYIFDSKGKPVNVNHEEYHSVRVEKVLPIHDYIIQNTQHLPEQTRNLLLSTKDYCTPEDIDALLSLLKKPEDIEILNKLLSTKGSDKKPIRIIGDALKLSEQKFGVRDIIKVFESDKAKNYVLDCINKNKRVMRSKAEGLLLPGKTFDGIPKFNLNERVDLSYRTQDVTVEGVRDIPQAYATDVSVQNLINGKIPNGEAGCINGKMYYRIDGELRPIRLTKETFDRLFPVEERYNIKQGGIGDCWLISELGGYMSTPRGRAVIYDMFRQEGKDIFIKFPNSDNIEVKFNNGKLNKLSAVSIYKAENGKLKIGTGDAHVHASDGVRMVEQALSYVIDNYPETFIQYVANKTFFMNKQMQNLEASTRAMTKPQVSGMMFLGNFEEVAYCHTYRGGIRLDQNVRMTSDVEEALNILAETMRTDENVFGSIGFENDIQLGGHNKNLISNHKYRVVGYNKETKTAYFVNPHESNVCIEVPLELIRAAKPEFDVYRIVLDKPRNIAEPNSGVHVDGSKGSNPVAESKPGEVAKNILRDNDGKITKFEQNGVVYEFPEPLSEPIFNAWYRQNNLLNSLEKMGAEQANGIAVDNFLFTKTSNINNGTGSIKIIDEVTGKSYHMQYENGRLTAMKVGHSATNSHASGSFELKDNGGRSPRTQKPEDPTKLQNHSTGEQNGVKNKPTEPGQPAPGETASKKPEIVKENIISSDEFKQQMLNLGVSNYNIEFLMKNFADIDGNISQDVVNIITSDKQLFKQMMARRPDLVVSSLKVMKDFDGHFLKDAVNYVQKEIANGNSFHKATSFLSAVKREMGKIDAANIKLFSDIVSKFGNNRHGVMDLIIKAMPSEQPEIMNKLAELQNNPKYNDIIGIIESISKDNKISLSTIKDAEALVANIDSFTYYRLTEYLKKTNSKFNYEDAMLASNLIKQGINVPEKIDMCIDFMKISGNVDINNIPVADIKNLLDNFTSAESLKCRDGVINLYKKSVDMGMSKEQYFDILAKNKENLEYFKFDEVQDIILNNPDKNYRIVKNSTTDKFFSIEKYKPATYERLNYSINEDGNLVYLNKEIETIKKGKTTIEVEYPDGSKKRLYNDGALDFSQLSNSTLEEVIDRYGRRVSRTLSKPSKSNPGVTVTLREIYDNAGNVIEVKEIGKVTRHGSSGDKIKIKRKYVSPSGVESTHTIVQRKKGTYSKFETNGTEIVRRFRNFENGETITIVNGEKFVSKFKDNTIEVTRQTRDGRTQTVVLDSNLLDFNLLDLYKQLPGDYLFRLKELGIKVKLGYEKNNACFNLNENTIYISEELKNNPFTFAHEYGHAMDLTNLNKLSSSSELKEIYEKELSIFCKERTSVEHNIIAYFTKANERSIDAGLEEVVAEVNAISSGLLNDANHHLMRAKILQENFPETTAYIINAFKTMN